MAKAKVEEKEKEKQGKERKGGEKEKVYDVAILGAGPAGLTAAIYCSRYGLSAIVISKDIGGVANYADIIENYPGFEGKGIELMQRFAEQAKKQGAEIIHSELVGVERSGKEFMISTKNKEIKTRAIIIALGTEHKRLGIPGEAKFIGRGVSFCSACDAPLYKNKIVAVIGGGNAAATSALISATHSSKVFLIPRQKGLSAENIRVEKIKSNKKIEVLSETVPLEIKGNDFVEALVLKQGDKTSEIKLNGIFVEIGSVPATILAKELGVDLDDKGYVITDENMYTNVKGILAAGDIVKSRLKQVIVSAAQGAIAAKSAYDYVNQ